MTMSRDNRELLRVGLAGVSRGSPLSDRILLALLNDLDAVEAQLAAALAVLREVEFGDHTDFGDMCPLCTAGRAAQGKDPGSPHSAGCKLAAVLAGEPRCPVCGGLPLPGCDGKHLCPAPPAAP